MEVCWEEEALWVGRVAEAWRRASKAQAGALLSETGHRLVWWQDSESCTSGCWEPCLFCVEYVLCEMWLALARRTVAPQHQRLPVTTTCGAVFLYLVSVFCNVPLLGTVQTVESLP